MLQLTPRREPGLFCVHRRRPASSRPRITPSTTNAIATAIRMTGSALEPPFGSRYANRDALTCSTSTRPSSQTRPATRLRSPTRVTVVTTPLARERPLTTGRGPMPDEVEVMGEFLVALRIALNRLPITSPWRRPLRRLAGRIDRALRRRARAPLRLLPGGRAPGRASPRSGQAEP